MSMAENLLKVAKEGGFKKGDWDYKTHDEFGMGHASYWLGNDEKGIMIMKDPKFYSVIVFEGIVPVLTEMNGAAKELFEIIGGCKDEA